MNIVTERIHPTKELDLQVNDDIKDVGKIIAAVSIAFLFLFAVACLALCRMPFFWLRPRLKPPAR